MPSWGLNLMSRASVFHTTARTWACSSLSEKYQWPEPASLRFEISPSTHTSANSVSSTPWRRSVSSRTLHARRRGNRGDAAPKSIPFCSMAVDALILARGGSYDSGMSLSRSRAFFLLSLFTGVLLGVFVSVALQRTLSPGGGPSASAAPAEPRAAALRQDLDAEESKTIALFQRASVSVAFVTNRVRRMDFWTRNVFEVPQGTGSAFLWDDRGHVVTNYHVVQDATSAQVTLGDQDYEASLVGAAPEHDLAVLRIRQGSE